MSLSVCVSVCVSVSLSVSPSLYVMLSLSWIVNLLLTRLSWWASQLSNLDTWVVEWKVTEEQKRVLYKTIGNTLFEAKKE